MRRNLSTALAAVIALRRGGDGPTLVCAGVDRGIGAGLKEDAVRAGDAAAIVLTGPVSDEVLLNLYRGAAVLAYPSRYEGFGLPILEAMQCGIPVVAARTSSLPELVGDAGPARRPARRRGVDRGARRHPREPGRIRAPARQLARARRALLVGSHGARDTGGAARLRGEREGARAMTPRVAVIVVNFNTGEDTVACVAAAIADAGASLGDVDRGRQRFERRQRRRHPGSDRGQTAV